MQRPAKRLKQVIGVSACNLAFIDGNLYIIVAFQDQDLNWRILYRSEEKRAAFNVEWDSILFTETLHGQDGDAQNSVNIAVALCSGDNNRADVETDNTSTVVETEHHHLISLFASAACSTPLAAWKLYLGDLHYLGEKWNSNAHFQKNSIVLEFRDGYYCYPEAAASPPSTLSDEGGAFSADETAQLSSTRKEISIDQMQQYILSLTALRTRVQDLAAASVSKQEELERGLQRASLRRERASQLAALEQETRALRYRSKAVHEQLTSMQGRAALVDKKASVHAQALVAALKIAHASERRVNEAAIAAAGDSGQGRLTVILRELVTRRCLMICQLCKILRLGPTAVKIARPPPGGFITDVLESHWTGGKGSSSLGSNLVVAKSLVNSESFAPPSTQGSKDTPGAYQERVILSIGGLQVLAPEILRKIFTESYLTAEDDIEQDRALSVALGYSALLISKAAKYLDVPLRYPLRCRGSTSSILDGWRPVGMWTEDQPEIASKGFYLFFGGTSSSTSSSTTGDGGGGGGGRKHGTAMPRNEYPLHCQGGARDRAKFAMGVFLLNKNISQVLEAHGLVAAGPSQLLENMYKMLLTSRSVGAA